MLFRRIKNSASSLKGLQEFLSGLALDRSQSALSSSTRVIKSFPAMKKRSQTSIARHIFEKMLRQLGDHQRMEFQLPDRFKKRFQCRPVKRMKLTKGVGECESATSSKRKIPSASGKSSEHQIESDNDEHSSDGVHIENQKPQQEPAILIQTQQPKPQLASGAQTQLLHTNPNPSLSTSTDSMGRKRAKIATSHAHELEFSVTKCLQVMTKLPGLTRKKLKDHNVFREKDSREIFMGLPNDLQTDWLKSMLV